VHLDVTDGQATRLDALAVLDQLPTAVLVVDAVGQITWVNQRTEVLFGYRPEELVDTNILGHFDLEWNSLALESIAYAIDTPGVRLPTLYRVHVKHGPPVIVEVIANNQLHNPAINGLVAQLRVWEEQQLLDQILDSLGGGEPIERTMALLIAVAREQMVEAAAAGYACAAGTLDLIAAAGPAQHMAKAAEALAPLETPWGRAAAVDEPVIVERIDQLPDALRLAAGERDLAACWAYPVHRQGSSDVIGILVFWRSEPGPPEPSTRTMINRLVQLAALAMTRAEHVSALLHAAEHDPLTDLPNRDTFFRRVDGDLADARHRVGVLYVDLDGFKQVNDQHGHSQGDRVLVEVANRLVAETRRDDLVARLGGDEFAVVCAGVGDQDLIALADRIITSVNRPIEGIEGATFSVGATIGVAVAEPGSSTGDVLVDRADAALLATKSTRKGTWRLA